MWLPQGRGYVRKTLNAGLCDVIVGVPAGFDLSIQGSVEFVGFATASGSVDVTISGGAFQLTFNVQFALGPLTFSRGADRKHRRTVRIPGTGIWHTKTLGRRKS